MKVCILGGSGSMAEAAIRELNKEDIVKQLIIADINLEKAKEISQKTGTKATAVKVNAKDHQNLVEILKGNDVALGFIGPFYIFESKIAKACIDAGVNYVSICDDYDAYLDVIKLHDEAKKAGITVITGLGNSPGITNILAKKGYLSMDTPRKINVNWAGGSNEKIGPANVKHVMHIFSGTTLQFLNGKQVRVKTGTACKVVEFPEPMGKLPVYYTGHAESVSIPMNLKDLEEVTLHGGTHPPYIARLATRVGAFGLTNTPKKRDIAAKIFVPITNIGLFSMGGIDKSVFRVDVYGTNKGRDCHHYYSGVGHIADITSIPTVVGALMLYKGEIKGPGVFAPEAIFEPDVFLTELKKRGIELFFNE